MINQISTTIFYHLAQINQNDVNLPNVTANSDSLKTVLQLVFGVITLVTVIYIVLTGLKLIVTQGDPQAISKARQGIIYAVLGLIIALSAEIIVTFVVGEI